MYIPQNRVISNLYTKGGEFVKIGTKENYVGYYHKTYQNRFFSGKTSNSSNVFEIVPTPEDYGGGPEAFLEEQGETFGDGDAGDGYAVELSIHQTPIYNNSTYRNISDINSNFEIDIKIKSYTHIPTQDEIEKGVFDMFLVIHSNTKKVTQISKQLFEQIQDTSDEGIKALYTVITLPWVIKGEESKVYQTNLNSVKSAQKVNLITQQDDLLVKYFSNNLTKNYLKWPGVIFVEKNTRITTNKKSIDEKLPAVYQLGNKINYYSNTNIPPNQNCSNCIFVKNNFCNKWNASIERNYWCKAYNGEYGKGEILATGSYQSPSDSLSSPNYSLPSSTSMPSSTQTGGGYSGGSGY